MTQAPNASYATSFLCFFVRGGDKNKSTYMYILLNGLGDNTGGYLTSSVRIFLSPERTSKMHPRIITKTIQ